jgi:hypothetical protein
MQDRQDALQQQLIQYRAENRAFMALMLQHSGISAPPVQSAPPSSLHAPVVPSILSAPPAVTSPLRLVTLAFTSPALSSICPQPPVPLASAVTVTLKLYTKSTRESSSFCVFHLHHKKSTYVIESD